MGPTMIRVAALVYDEQSRRKLQRAFRGAAELHVFRSGTTLLASLSTGGASVVICELRDASGRLTVPIIQELRDRQPALPIVAYTEFNSRRARDIKLASEAGARHLIIREYDDVESMVRAVVRTVDAEAMAARVLTYLDLQVPAAAREFIEHCFRNAQHGIRVSDVAVHLRANRKTLRNRLRAAHLPPPHKILGWSRLLLAIRLLNDGGYSVERVAQELNFPGGASLRNMLKRYIGKSPGELRHDDGFQQMLEGFRAALAGAKKKAKVAEQH
jgi:AraC-like DNA-binding protein